VTTTKPTEELERLFGPDWPTAIDELTEGSLVGLTFTQEVQILGFSYRHKTLCMYVNLDGERRTIPLEDIEEVSLD
jgi:hypothetical protein